MERYVYFVINIMHIVESIILIIIILMTKPYAKSHYQKRYKCPHEYFREKYWTPEAIMA